MSVHKMRFTLLLTGAFGWQPEVSSCNLPVRNSKTYVQDNCYPLKLNRDKYLKARTAWTFTDSQRSQCKYEVKMEVRAVCLARYNIRIAK